jgi:hypothetical protein
LTGCCVTVAIQLKVAAGIVTLEVRLIPTCCPEHIDFVRTVFETVGKGNTVTVFGVGEPVQPSAEAVTE